MKSGDFANKSGRLIQQNMEQNGHLSDKIWNNMRFNHQGYGTLWNNDDFSHDSTS